VLRVEHVVGLAPERWLNHAVSTGPLLAVPADYAYATLGLGPVRAQAGSGGRLSLSE
jgi:hypothetical protein